MLLLRLQSSPAYLTAIDQGSSLALELIARWRAVMASRLAD